MGSWKYIVYAPYSKMAATQKKNWREMHENEVIRASLGGIRIRKLASWPYDMIAIFLHFQTRFLCLWICKTVQKQHLALMTSFSFNSRQFFSEWRPFLNKVYTIEKKKSLLLLLSLAIHRFGIYSYNYLPFLFFLFLGGSSFWLARGDHVWAKL